MRRYVKYIIIFVLLVLLIVGLCWPQNDDNTKVLIDVNNYGKITVSLDSDNAPITVKNFLLLVQDKFYDNLTFHRIIEGFMIQGGDPNKDGTGGSVNKIIGEFSENGVDNTINHKRGVISMARSSDNNSASSQFFIMQKDNTYLDGKYAAFGHVTSGMEVVDKIVGNVSKYGDDNGIIPVQYQPVIKSIKVIK